jgi:AcrR family transcriptional regulator
MRSSSWPVERSFCYAFAMSAIQAARLAHREALLEQLMTVFQEQGYEGATLAKLAAATGLGKASLYHHFPGGKDEITRILLRKAIANLERVGFSKLKGPEPAGDRLGALLDGFCEYVDQGRGHCLLSVLAQGGARADYGAEIAAQFADWLQILTELFEERGEKRKRARRSANDFVEKIYGILLVSKILGQPEHFQRATKRLRKTL